MHNTPAKLHVLDMSKPLDPHSLSSIAEACKEWGFFYVSNHGISKNLCDEIHSLSTKIFNLNHDVKLKLGPFSSLKAYTPHFIASPFFESLKVCGPDFMSSAQSCVDALLLDGEKDYSQFSVVMKEYGDKMSELSKSIIKIVLMSLGEGFEKKYYESEFGNCHGYLRINNYTPPKDFENQEQVEGLGMHTDMSCITIAFQDELGDLQVRSKDGKWVEIVPLGGTLVVNVGDLLQAWSNDKFRSSEHRVVLKKHVNRFSMAFFWCFEDEKVILAPDEVVGKDNNNNNNMRFYCPFVCSQYVKFRENDEKGKYEKIGFTVKDYAGLEFDFLGPKL